MGLFQSTKLIKQIVNDRMYPLTLSGLDDAMRELSRKQVTKKAVLMVSVSAP